jgi:nucleoside-diphosphate kinase
MATERTFVFVKPDGVARGLAGKVVARFEEKGLKVVGLKMLHMTRAQAEKLYGVHKGKPFFEGLVKHSTSGPIVAFVLEGRNAFAVARKLIGATNAAEADPGSIRGDYAMEIGRNVVHGSTSVNDAEAEMSIFFDKKDLVDYKRAEEPLLYE